MTYEIYTNKVILINASTFENFRKNLKIKREKNKRKLIGFTGIDDELNRKILEKEKVDIFMPLLFHRKDWQKQRNSGFNQVMAKQAKKNNVTIAINLDELINTGGKEKAEILARIHQNIKLCNKNKLKMTFLPSKDSYDLKALGLVLGMPTWMFKEFKPFN